MDITRTTTSKTRNTMRLAAALVIMGGAQTAYAVAPCTGPPVVGGYVWNTNGPSGDITVRPDVPAGTMLSGWSEWNYRPAQYSCNYRTGTIMGAVFRFINTVTSGVMVNGRHYVTVQTNVQGVHLIAEVTASTNSAGDFIWGGYPLTRDWFAPVKHQVAATYTMPWGIGIRYAYVKSQLGIQAGQVFKKGHIAMVGMDLSPFTNPSNLGEIHIQSDGPIVRVEGCTTPDVTVNLGAHKEADFPAVGSRRGENGDWTDFKIDLNSCPDELTSIVYALTPVNGAVSGSLQGTAKLTPASTATGIGVQITDTNNAAVPFVLGRPLRVTGAEAYQIPLRASMIRTGDAFRAGSVEALVDFTMTYN